LKPVWVSLIALAGDEKTKPRKEAWLVSETGW
jgi:hypothetical protein